MEELFTFTFYWKGGKREVLSGRNVFDALKFAGYKLKDQDNLIFDCIGDNKDYKWNGKEWIKKGGVKK